MAEDDAPLVGDEFSEMFRNMFGDTVLGEDAVETWMAYPVEVRGDMYGRVGADLFIDVGSVPPEFWYVIGQAQNDPEGVEWAHNEFIKANMGINLKEILSNDYINQSIRAMTGSEGQLINGRPWSRDDTFTSVQAYNEGRTNLASDSGIAPLIDPNSTVGRVGNLALTLAALYYGAKVTVSGASAAKRGAGFLRSTRAGGWMAEAFATAAKTDSKAFLYAQKFARVGAGTGGVIAAGSLLQTGWIASYGDPEELEQQLVDVVDKAKLELAGFSFEQQGTAFGVERSGGLLTSETVILDPDGNPISLEEAKMQAGLLPDVPIEGVDEDEDNATTTTTSPTFTGAESPAPGSIGQYGTTGQISDEGMISVEELLDQIQGLGDKTAEEKYLEDPYIGVSRDYARITRGGSDIPSYFGDFDDPAIQDEWRYYFGKPVYHESSVLDEIASWDYLTVLKFQEQAIAAGLINPESSFNGAFYVPGSVDGFTERALAGAMNQANINGDQQTYWDALDLMIEGREKAKEIYGDKEQPPTWTPPTYFAPDYATISQNVKSIFAQRLGRDPNDWEMDLLADQFKSDHRAEYEAEELGPSSRAFGREMEAFEARGREEEEGEIVLPDAQPESVQGVDPMARMLENFDTEFSNEVDARGRWDDVQSKTSNLFGSLSRLGNA